MLLTVDYVLLLASFDIKRTMCPWISATFWFYYDVNIILVTMGRECLEARRVSMKQELGERFLHFYEERVLFQCDSLCLARG